MEKIAQHLNIKWNGGNDLQIWRNETKNDKKVKFKLIYESGC